MNRRHPHMNRLLRFLRMFRLEDTLTTTKVALSKLALRLLDRHLEQAMVSELLPRLVVDGPVPRSQQIEDLLWLLRGAPVNPIEIV